MANGYAGKILRVNLTKSEISAIDTGIYEQWVGGHGMVDMYRSIVQSCDTYYYMLANDLGVDAIHDFMAPLGLGQMTGIDMHGELRGILPSTEWKRTAYRRKEQQKWYAGETISLGIGQGYNNFTMLQMATAVSTLATGGQRFKPRLVREIEDHPFSVIFFENIEEAHAAVLYFLGKVLTRGEVVNQIVVDPVTAKWARVALERLRVRRKGWSLEFVLDILGIISNMSWNVQGRHSPAAARGAVRQSAGPPPGNSETADGCQDQAAQPDPTGRPTGWQDAEDWAPDSQNSGPRCRTPLRWPENQTARTVHPAETSRTPPPDRGHKRRRRCSTFPADNRSAARRRGSRPA